MNGPVEWTETIANLMNEISRGEWLIISAMRLNGRAITVAAAV